MKEIKHGLEDLSVLVDGETKSVSVGEEEENLLDLDTSMATITNENDDIAVIADIEKGGLEKKLEGFMEYLVEEKKAEGKRNEEMRQDIKNLSKKIEIITQQEELEAYKEIVKQSRTSLEEYIATNNALEEENKARLEEIAGKVEVIRAREVEIKDIEGKTREQFGIIKTQEKEIKELERRGGEQEREIKELRKREGEREKDIRTLKSKVGEMEVLKVKDPDLEKLRNTLKAANRKRSGEKENIEQPAVLKIPKVAFPTASASRTEEIKELKPIAFLGDSHIKSCLMSETIGAAIQLSGSEKMVRLRSGATLECLMRVSSDVFQKAKKMVISCGVRELHEQWKTSRDRERTIKDIASKIVELGKKYLKLGKEVMYIAPPLLKKSEDYQEAMLEEAVRKLAPEGMTVMGNATRMKRDMEKVGEAKVYEEWLADKHHMRVQKFTEEFRYYGRKVLGWELTEGTVTRNHTYAVVEQKIRNEGRCNRCGRPDTECRQPGKCTQQVGCNDCKNRQHNTSVCPIKYMSCFHCGSSKDHNKNHCEGWW